MNSFELYKKEYIDKSFERKDLFLLLRQRYKICKALYPGSFVHVTPSLVFQEVVYVDSDKNAKRFFEEIDSIKQFINLNKSYKEESSYRFMYQDYSTPIDLPYDYFDLLISQWAGPISQSCKKYLKPGGFLLANNSHADAGIAFLDHDYLLVSAIKYSNGKFKIMENKLDIYFIPKSSKIISKESLIKSGKGIAYKNTAHSYLFMKKGENILI
ncbi:MAG TPA: hypothetical protein G4N92_05725 [Anaerolineae bacterium]|nr:hypothetical protein [Anaerolineae bacterium]